MRLDIAKPAPDVPAIRRRHVVAGLIASQSLVHSARAADTSLTRVLERGRLRVSIGQGLSLPTAPPGARNSPLQDRFGVQVAEMIAKDLGVRLELLVLADPTMPGVAVTSGDADVQVPAMVSALSARRFLLSTPFGALDGVVVAPARPRLRDGSALDGARLGMLVQYRDAFADDWPAPAGAVVTPLQSFHDAEVALLTGAVDAALLPAIHVRTIIQRNPGAGLAAHFSLGNYTYAAGVQFGAQDLLLAVNASISDAQHDGRLATMFRDATGFPPQPLAPL